MKTVKEQENIHLLDNWEDFDLLLLGSLLQ